MKPKKLDKEYKDMCQKDGIIHLHAIEKARESVIKAAKKWNFRYCGNEKPLYKAVEALLKLEKKS